MSNWFSKTELDESEIVLLKPQLKQLKAEQDAARVGEQLAFQPPLERLRQQRECVIPVLQASADQARDKEVKAIAAAKEATAARGRAASELLLRSNWFDHQENLLWSKIRDLAPAVITERQRKWHGLVEESRLKVDSEERRTSPNIFGRWHTIFVSNVAMVKRRVDVITEAIKAAEKMKFEALAEAEIIQRLDAMEKCFPSLSNDRETITIPGPDNTSELRRFGW